MLCNTAIFYDIENLLGIFSGKANTVLNLDEIYRRVLEMEGVHGVSIQRAYADWALQPNRALQESVLQVGIEPIQIFNTNQNDRVKNAADVCLIIDAVELISKRPEIENYVIASGDGIFAFLSKKLHEHGRRVIGCGFDRNANLTFRNSCDYYISLEKTDKSLVATTSARRKSRKQEVAPVVVEEVTQAPEQAPAKKIPNKFPKTKYSEMLAKADIPIWRDTHDLAGGLHTIRKIIEGLFSEEVDGLADLEISVFKTYVVHYIPSFRVNRYNFTRFGEFMQFVLTGSPYCLYTIDESVCKIARRGAVTKGTVLEDVKGLIVTAEDGSRYGSIFNVPEDVAFIYTILPSVPDKNQKRKTIEAADKSKNGRRKNVSAKADVTTDTEGGAKPDTAAEAMPDAVTKVSFDTMLESPDTTSDSTPSAITATDMQAVSRATSPENEAKMDEGSLRKWIKSRFQALSEANAISPGEARLLATPEYSRKTFGIRTPIFREIESRSNLQEQRSVRGKVKYWKETFVYNGKHYLVYKDWVANLHRDRFSVWLTSVEK